MEMVYIMVYSYGMHLYIMVYIFFLLLGLNRDNIKYKKRSTNITNYCLSFPYKFVLLVRVGHD